MTEEQAHRPHETIRLWVENRTGRTAWFTDGLLGVTGLGYDGAAARWVEVDLCPSTSEAGAKGAQSGVPHGEDRVFLAGEDMDVRTDRTVRLVVTGHTDLTDSQRARLCTAYTDIEILQ